MVKVALLLSVWFLSFGGCGPLGACFVTRRRVSAPEGTAALHSASDVDEPSDVDERGVDLGTHLSDCSNE